MSDGRIQPGDKIVKVSSFFITSVYPVYLSLDLLNFPVYFSNFFYVFTVSP